jgi:hypothetical protein
MKTWMCALLGLTPNLLAWNYALAGEPGEPQQRVIVRTLGQPGAAAGEAQGELLIDGDLGDVAGNVVIVADAQATGDGRSDQKPKQIRVITRSKSDDPDAAQRGWLGVSIEVVPESMAAQLGTPKKGVMVGNVVEGSPADTAGIQANDMIVAINGEEVAGDVGPAVDLIKSRKPGETINVGILRGNQPMTLKVTLGSRADMKNFDWKYEGMPAQVEEQIKTRGKFMVKGADGELIVKDLGELDALKNLPENIRMFVPQSGTRNTQVFVNNGLKTIKMNVEKDGSSMSIEQEEGGPITVHRTDDDGKEVVAIYDNEDALKAADQEAYELYSQAGQTVFFHVDRDGEDGDGQQFFLQGGDAGQWRVHLEKSLSEAKEAYGDAMEELHANLMELKNQGTFDVEKFHGMFNAQGGKGFGNAFTFTTGKPTHRFDVNADGSIEVSIRKGDSEMAQSFRNEADMAKRRPDLYEKYQDVKAADEE